MDKYLNEMAKKLRKFEGYSMQDEICRVAGDHFLVGIGYACDVDKMYLGEMCNFLYDYSATT